jgi:hypothetical protein
MSYSGLFVRDNIGQTPSGGQDGWSGCPDIILYGLTPASSTGIFTSTAGYGQDFGSTVYMNQANYVYLRALNTTGGAITGAAWFYYTESDLMLWPSNWQSADILVAGEAMNYQQIAATNPNDVCVTGAFVWTPPSFSPGHSGGDHYCCIAWMENPPLQPPPWTPLQSIPNFTDCTQLANFVCAHSNMGWRNTVDVSQAGPSWQQTVTVTGPTGGGQFKIGIACDNMPTDGYFAYSVPGSGGVPTVNFPKTLIWDPDAAPTTTVTWPAEFATSITISWWQGAIVPPKGAAISPVVILPSSQVDSKALIKARRTAPWRFRTTRNFDQAGLYTGQDESGVIFGSTPFQF